MIHEDERSPEGERLRFVLHLGDFTYEVVWYPEDRPQGMYDRRLRNVFRLPHGEKIADFHVPTTVEDYRTLYREYLRDPDQLEGAPVEDDEIEHFAAVSAGHHFRALGMKPPPTREVVRAPVDDQGREIQAG